MGLWKEGFDQFMTTELDFNDGAQACDVEFQATHRVTNQTTTYFGSSANNHGHAEIDGLYQFLTDIRWDQAAFDDYDLNISCLAKPCCKYCSAVMGLLWVAPADNTYKSRKPMGVSYALPPMIRTFLVKRLKVTESKILQELCG